MRRHRFEHDNDVPSGWTRLLPTDSSPNNAHPATPPTAASAFVHADRHNAHQNQKRRQQQPHGPDALGLSKALAPARQLQRELRVREQLQAVASTSATSSSPRHRRLLKQQQSVASTTATGDDGSRAAAEAFSPLRSLRLARLRRRPSTSEETRAPTPTTALERRDASADDRPLQLRSRETPDLPLHELIRTMDDAVAADPFVDSSQAAITHAFMAQWLARFDASRHQYKSVGTWYAVWCSNEVGWRRPVN